MIKIKKEAVLIKPKDIKPSSEFFEVIGVINPSAVRMPDGDIMLYVRVIEKLIDDKDEKYYYSPRMSGEDNFKIVYDKFKKKDMIEKNPLDFMFKDGTKRLTFISHFRKIILGDNGFTIKSISQTPSFYGLSWDGELGVEDARIVKIGNLYVMTYVTLARGTNISTNLAISHDCESWFRRGIIFSEQNKDCVIFPEKIRSKYVAFNRPEGNFSFSSPDIQLSYSKDLEYWGETQSLVLARKGEWDSGRVGAGPPPIKTKKGWLLIYHGVKEREFEIDDFKNKLKKIAGIKTQRIERIYYDVGAVLLDLKNPKKVIAKVHNPIITPSKLYERGKIENKNVVFPTGVVLDKNGKDILIYSGGGDIVTTVKKISLNEIFKRMKRVEL